MAYICRLNQATRMGLSLLHSLLTATTIWVNKSSGTGMCWLIQTLFQQRTAEKQPLADAVLPGKITFINIQRNHDRVLNFYRIANKRL